MTTRLSPYRELAWTAWREVIREPLVVGLSIVFPLCFVAMFAFLPDVSLAPGEPEVSALTFGLPAVWLMGIMSLALTGTSAPLTTLREKGVLRALGLTPVDKLTFLAALLPARLVVCLLEGVLILILSALAGVMSIADPLLLLWAFLLTFAVNMALGCFLGGLMKSSQLVGGLSGVLVPAVLILSGVILPLGIFPPVLKTIAEFLPFTYMGDLLRHAIAGVPAEFSVTVSSAVLLGSCAVLVVLTLATFRWDERDA
ncbi:ABC transporter permease [Sphaerimonospora mesophila]|uniref:ABC transporter permease n=1 Tax=Sphaerimonospora mesophila TaxID=37483 RepID=UPI0006E18557